MIILNSVPSMVEGAIIGQITIFFLGYVKSKSSQFYKKKRLRGYLDNQNGLNQNNSIINIDHAIPFYKEENINLCDCGLEFYLSVSNDLNKKLQSQNFSSREQTIFGRGRDISIIEEITKIDGLNKIIQEKVSIVSKELLEKLNNSCIRFNGQLYGVRKASGNRTEGDEQATLKIEFFKTDYFTYMVMAATYKQLVQSGYKFDFSNDFVSFHNYYPFTSSFGLTCLLIINRGKGDEVLLCRRSKHLEVNPGKLHFSMNEALSMKDVDSEIIETTPSFKSCLFRGLYEELGLSKKNIHEYKFMDFLFDSDRCELGIFSYSRIIFDESFQLKHMRHDFSIAQDSEIEIQDTKFLPIKNIEQFVEENADDLSPGCATGLINLLSRYKAGYIKEKP